jgi:hypothetical protein
MLYARETWARLFPVLMTVVFLGCSDPSAPGAEDGGGAEDGEVTEDGTAQGDGCDAGGDCVDADHANDADAVDDADADVDPDANPPSPCQPECGPDDYCLPSAVCAPRCSEDCGEPGPLLDPSGGAPVRPLVSDGERLFYTTRRVTTFDIATSVAETFYRWDLRGEPVELSTGWRWTDRLAFYDGYLYRVSHFPDFDTSMERLTTDGEPNHQFGRYTSDFWFTSHTVWWQDENTVSRTDTSSDLTPVFVAGGQTWRTGNTTHIFRVVVSGAGCTVLQAAVTDPTVEEILTRIAPCYSYPETFFADDDTLFLDSPTRRMAPRGIGLKRIALDGTGDTLALAPMDTETRNVFLVDDWVYWGAQDDAVTGSIHRSHRDMLLPSEELLRGDLDPEVFTIVGDSLVWSNRRRLYVKPLRPLACSASVPCSGGAHCEEDGRCK